MPVSADLSCSVQAVSASLLPRLSLRGGSSNPEAVWAAAVDPASGKTYYFNVNTKEVTWVLPPGAMLRPPRTAPAAASATSTGGATVGQPQTAGQQEPATPVVNQQAVSSHDKSTAASVEPVVTVHTPPVLADVPPGFGRKVPEPVAAASDAAATPPLGHAVPGATTAPTADTSAAAAAAAAAVAASAVATGLGAPAAAAAYQQESHTGQGTASAATAPSASPSRPQLSPNSLWKEVADPSSGKVYYYHTITKESVWTLPTIVEDQTASSFTGLFSALRKTAGVGS